MSSPGAAAGGGAAAGSGSPSLPDSGKDEENICKDRDDVSDVPTSTKRKKKAGGFNLRKSMAWNPAFFTEQGLLDDLELSRLCGSNTKVKGSPSSRSGSKMSPLLMFGRSGKRSVRREVVVNPSGTGLAKYRSTDNMGRKLSSTAATSVRDEHKEDVATEHTKSARSIKRSIPRSPAAYRQKKVPNSIAATPMSKLPKFMPKTSQASMPPIPRSKAPTTKIPKLNKNTVPAKGHQVPSVDVAPSKLKMEPLLSTTSSAHDLPRDLEFSIACKRISESSAPPHIPEVSNSSGYGEIVSSYSQSRPSTSTGAPAPAFAKPSGLRMPSPSMGYFSKAKASPSNGNYSPRNVEKYLSGIPSSIIKPPRQKQPEDLGSRPFLPEGQHTNGSAVSKSPIQNLPAGGLAASSVVSFPWTGFVDPSPVKESSRMEIIIDSGRTGNTNTQAFGNNNSKKASSSEKTNDGGRAPNGDDDAQQGEGMSITKENKLPGDSDSLQALCSPAEAFDRSEFLSPSISSEVFYINDPRESRSANGAAIGTDFKNCPDGEASSFTYVASLKSDCSQGSNSMLDLGSTSDYKHAECSTSMEATPFITLHAEHEALDVVISDSKPDIAESEAEFHGSSPDKTQPVLSEEPNGEGRSMVLDINNPSDVDRALFIEYVDPSDVDGALFIEKKKQKDISSANSVIKDRLKHLVPFSEEWLAAMEAYGEEILERKSGAVQNSPTEKTVPEPSPWSPVKRKAQDVGPFDCTKYSKSVLTSDGP